MPGRLLSNPLQAHDVRLIDGQPGDKSQLAGFVLRNRHSNFGHAQIPEHQRCARALSILEPERKPPLLADRAFQSLTLLGAHYSASPMTAAAPSRTSKVSLPSSAPTTTLSPGLSDPPKTIRESSLSTRRWMVLRKGRAPNSGSKPSSARSSTAPSVNSTSMSWARRRLVV